MLTIEKRAPDRVDIILNGAIDSVAMRQGLTRLIEASQDVTGGRMLYTIKDFELPTLGAFAVEMGMLPQLFGMLQKYDRCAVLCDTRWLRTAAEWEGRLLPGLEIRAFATDQADAAEAWLAGA